MRIRELKKEVENIETREGKKEAIPKAGMELSDDELDKVSGGVDQEPDEPMGLCPASASFEKWVE